MKIIVIGVIAIMSISFGLGSLSLVREINEEKYFTMEEINEIQVNLASEPVHIIQTETSNEVKINFHGKAMQEIKLASEIHNKILVVKAQRKYEKMPIYEDVVMDICIPTEYGKNLTINTSSGNIKIGSLDLANFTLNTSSGKLEAEKINAEKISMNTSSGSLNIKKLDGKELEIKGKSSAVNIDECLVKEGRVETSSGSITLKNSSGNFDLKGSSGTVLLTCKEFGNQNINIETSSGGVTLELPSTAEFLIEAKTSSGKFQSDFPIKTVGNTNKKSIDGQIGMKNNKVVLQTSSGSMKILKK
jgi:DUF4097 and DUF4098 domain-containing protein YvlB